MAVNSSFPGKDMSCLDDPALVTVSTEPRQLSQDDSDKLKAQNNRLLSDFQRTKLETQAAINWDKFYKRNETRFFKDRHWTTREFKELCGSDDTDKKRTLLEVGCGVGNLFYPLLQAGLNLRVYACDFSPRAIAFVKENPLYNPECVTAFVADITKSGSLSNSVPEGADLITSIFVLSAIGPEHHASAAANIAAVCRPGAVFLFRDYAVNDMTMVRFSTGSKIADRFYVRQDGTRSYFFTAEEVKSIFKRVGFTCRECQYVHRRTKNIKEGVDAARVFLQAKFVFTPTEDVSDKDSVIDNSAQES